MKTNIGIYELLNTIQMPKQPQHYKKENNTTTNSDYVDESNKQETNKCIQQKTFASVSTQTDSFEQHQLYESQFQKDQSQRQSQVLLSLMESIDLENFKPRQAVSVMEKPPVPFLMSHIQQVNPSVYHSLALDNQGNDFVHFVSNQIIDKSIKDIETTLLKYQQIIQSLIKGLKQEQTQITNYNKSLSFNEQISDQQSPGWGITPTLKVVDSFMSDSLL